MYYNPATVIKPGLLADAFP